MNNVYYWNDGITEAVVRRCSATLLKERVREFFKFFQNAYFYRALRWLLLELIKPISTSMDYAIGYKQHQGGKKKLNLTTLG